MTTPDHADHLPLTGERTVPGVPEENYWFRRHEAAYRHVATLIRNGNLVDVGCGEGYGTALLAERAARTVGVDYDAATVAHAARRYRHVSFVRANLAALPVRSNAADTLVALQVIEHVWDHAEFLGECRRVLRADGRLVMSTPNRLTFSPGRDQPVNPFHTKEFTCDELVAELRGSGFAINCVLGLQAGPRLGAFDERHGGSFVAAQLGTEPAAWPTQLRRDVAGVAVEDFPVLTADMRCVDEALDLVVVARPRA